MEAVSGTGEFVKIMVIVISAFQFFIFIAGFFIKSYFGTLKKDIAKLFELIEKKDGKCEKHGERLAYIESKVNGKGAR